MREDYHGSRFQHVGPILIGCISREASDLLDEIMEAYKEHYNPESHTAAPDDVYQFCYWLVRWSGLVRPS